jgi:hypothetical protein
MSSSFGPDIVAEKYYTVTFPMDLMNSSSVTDRTLGLGGGSIAPDQIYEYTVRFIAEGLSIKVKYPSRERRSVVLWRS